MSDAGITTTPLLPDDEMRGLGFTDRRAGYWYFCTRVGSNETVNFTIDKMSGSYEELVMDEFFGQPAFYGRMVPKFGLPIRIRVDGVIERLNAAGLNLAVDHSLYGVAL